jgi:hypothetical protein
MTKEQLLHTFSDAIANREGFFMSPSQCKRTHNFKRLPDGTIDYRTVAARNNNPGNLRSWGTRPVVDGYASFPTPADGWKALRSQVKKNVFERKLSFREFFAGERKPNGQLRRKDSYPGFAPAADSNDAVGYAESVLRYLGFLHHLPGTTIDTKIYTLVDKEESV